MSEAARLGSGWESTIYALGPTQILRIPEPDVATERQVRDRATFTASLPPLPFAVPRVREISVVARRLVVIEDRIEGQAMEQCFLVLPALRRRDALAAYLATAEAMAGVIATTERGDLLKEQPLRTARWADYLVARLRAAVEDEVLAETCRAYRDCGAIDRAVGSYAEPRKMRGAWGYLAAQCDDERSIAGDGVDRFQFHHQGW